MIPGGYENTHYKKSKLDKDKFFQCGGDYYDDDDEENFDEEEGFVFDFVSSNTKSLQSKHEADKQQSITANLPVKNDSAWDEEDNNRPNDADRSTKNKSKIVYELNNNYYFDESQYILDDLKNAILNRNLTNVQNLMQKHNLDVNCVLKSNWTPMMYAVTCGALDIVEYLVENGADVHFSDGKCFD